MKNLKIRVNYPGNRRFDRIITKIELERSIIPIPINTIGSSNIEISLDDFETKNKCQMCELYSKQVLSYNYCPNCGEKLR